MIFLLLTTRARLLFMLLIFAAPFTLQAQPVRPTRQSSLEAYSKADYSNALNQFSELLSLYPADPLYKYYTGVCLVRLEKDPSSAIKLLTEAQGAAGQLRTVPSDAVFWLGRAYQQAGLYKEALNAYDRFILQEGRKIAKEYNVNMFVEQSAAQNGELVIPVQKTDPPAEEPSVAQPEQIPVKTDTLPAMLESRLGEVLNSMRSDDTSQYVPLRMIGKLSEELSDEPDTLMLGPETKRADSEKGQDENIPDSNENIPLVREEQDLPKKEEKTKAQPVQKPVEVYNLFEIDSKRIYKPDEKIVVDGNIPQGLIYRVQVAVFRNPVAPSYFKGMDPVYGFTLAGKGLTIYYAGMFRQMKEASKALASVRQLGFKDALIASLMDGKSISADRAAILEKEWGSKPLYTRQSSMVEPADTLPPALSFRVSLARSEEALKEDVVDGMRRIAGARGFDLVILPDGTHVYLAGTFITFESAEEYSDLLVRNGFKDAMVSAWLGKKEIPVETAKALFEKIQ